VLSKHAALADGSHLADADQPDVFGKIRRRARAWPDIALRDQEGVILAVNGPSPTVGSRIRPAKAETCLARMNSAHPAVNYPATTPAGSVYLAVP